MGFLQLIIILSLIGLAYWFLTTYVSGNATINRIIGAVCVLIAILIVLEAFGILQMLTGLQVPQVR